MLAIVMMVVLVVTGIEALRISNVPARKNDTPVDVGLA
jgi:hypothetical protein